jgi:hypothetical protein
MDNPLFVEYFKRLGEHCSEIKEVTVPYKVRQGMRGNKDITDYIRERNGGVVIKSYEYIEDFNGDFIFKTEIMTPKTEKVIKL